MYDVIIVGAGPAGLFAARWLADNSKSKILVIEKGRDVEKRICPSKEYGKCVNCHPCNVVTGVGGS